jgi:hypothetical protein
VNLASTKGAEAAAIASIPPIYSKPTVYSAHENQLSPSRGSSSSGALAENAILSKPTTSAIAKTENHSAAEESESKQSVAKPSGEIAATGFELSEDELKMIEDLKARDLEVRAHEQAHKSVGGQYTGAISFSYQAGPDGKRYAVGGEVPIDVSPIPGDPQATITKMTIVSAAATAPAQPSAQDQMVAAQAARIMSEAQAELAQTKYEDVNNKEDVKKEEPSTNNSSAYTSNSLEEFQLVYQGDSQKINLVDTIA